VPDSVGFGICHIPNTNNTTRNKLIRRMHKHNKLHNKRIRNALPATAQLTKKTINKIKLYMHV